MSEKLPMTAEGLAKLKSELENLKNSERPSIIKAIAEAREHGDLSENAEYHAAREKQSFIEGRISELENKIRRAGLDYHDLSNTKTYNSWEEFKEKNTKKNICCLSSKGADSYWDTNLTKYDFLLFGPESIGLPNEIISSYKTITIPMKENSRSINLANSVGIVVFESLRQASVQ